MDLSSAALQEWLASIAGCNASVISLDSQVGAGFVCKPQQPCFDNLYLLKVVVQGSIRLKLFSLNDYMGLSQHPAICQAAADAAVHCGMGMCSVCIPAASSQSLYSANAFMCSALVRSLHHIRMINGVKA